MDRKSLIVVAACVALMLLWSMVLVPKLYPPQPLPPGTTNTVATPDTITATSVPPAVVVPALPTASPAPIPVPAFQTNAVEQIVALTNDNARYIFTSQGGGLKAVELVHYPETLSRQRRKQPLTNNLATLNTPAPAPVLALLGDANVQGDGIFTLTRTATGVRAEKSLTNGLRLVKEFELSTNYLVHATIHWENSSSRPLTVSAHEWVIGTATPMGPDDDEQNVGIMWYNGAKHEDILKSWFDNKSFLSCIGMGANQPRPEYRAGVSNVVWAAPHNQFFTLIAMPTQPAEQIVSRAFDLPRQSGDDRPANAPTQKGFFTSLVYPAVTIAPGQTAARQIYFYAGPKEYRTLAHIAGRFQNNVDAVMGFGFFGFFSKALLLGMNWLHHALNLSYGWAIIAITVIIKLLFWPLTKASTRSMKRMQALQPQMNALKEKYKDDPTKMNKKLMEFMRDNKVSPLGGCLPMVLQMPVFFGFFSMIRSAIELRGAHFLWVADLSKPDTLFMIPGLNFPFNLLPLLMGVTMLWQARLTPPSPGMDPTQQKMMKYMPLMFLVFLYNYSAALALYWTVQNLLTIVQTKLTKTTDPVVAAPATASVLTPLSKKKK